MRALKQLLPFNQQTQKCQSLTNDLDKNLSTTPPAATTHSILSYKLKLTSEGRRNQNSYLADARLSHQAGANPFRASTQIKRRISTAGTSKRFPKDFFRPEVRDLRGRKQPKLLLKWGTENRAPLQARKKQYSLNIDLQMTDNNPISTPKFHEPQIQQPQNEFLPKQIKVVSPFPQIRQLKLDAGEQIVRNPRPNFIKKMKRGELLKTKLQSNRSVNRVVQLCSIQSMQ